MTILDQYLRRNDRLVSLRRETGLKGKWMQHRMKTAKAAHQNFSRRRNVEIQPDDNDEISSTNRIEVGPLTVRSMKAEISDLIEQNGGDERGCTVLQMANALVGSDSVMSLYAKEQSLYDSSKAGIEIVRLKFSVLGLGRPRNQFIESKYKLVRALNVLERNPKSSEQRVRNWEEAQEVLSPILKFPPERIMSTSDESHEKQRALSKEEQALALRKQSTAEIDDFVRRHNERLSKEIQQIPLSANEKWRKISLHPSRTKLQKEASEEAGNNAYVDADGSLRQRLDEAYEKRDERAQQSKALLAVKDVEQRLNEIKKKEEEELERKKREEEAKNRASSLMRPLSDEEQELVHNAMYGIGPSDEIIAEVGTDSVQRGSMHRLQPGQWLNDEVIHYFYVMLAARDEELCRLNPNRKRSHFFKSFFITKLLNEGNANPALDGKYDYRSVKRWSKKVPGKDIFNLDKIFFPINQSQMHWLVAVAYMTEKRIQLYDSMGRGAGDSYYVQQIFKYIQDEHKDKKKCPLPDIDEWKILPCSDDTPQQRNGFDCGVFTCMFADFLSKDCPLVFSQDHVTQCRERIALSIMKGSAII